METKNNHAMKLLRERSLRVRHLMIDARLNIAQLVEQLNVHRSSFANAINCLRCGDKEMALLIRAEKHLQGLKSKIRGDLD